jgi:UDPglucose 6-dehydrogenase
VLGLTFKPNTDDMRDAPAISIVQALRDAGASIRAYDPEGMAAAAPLLGEIAYTDSAYAAAEDASAIVIVTEWDAFRALDFARLKAVMAVPVLVDLRNIYRADDLAAAGFTYRSVGRPGDGEPVVQPESFKVTELQ